MKKAVILFITVFLFVFGSMALLAKENEESQKISVKSKQVSNGVVFLTVQEGKNTLELQCNDGVSSCAALDPGDYLMVRLPKNHGLYDCANVEVYAQSASAERGNLLGNYCLVDAK